MNVFSIQAPDGQILDIEAADQATAFAGAQEWFSQQTTLPKKAQPTAGNEPGMGMLESFGRGALSGATLGGADEAAQMFGAKPETVEGLRANEKRARETAPWSYYTGQAVGGVAPFLIPGVGAVRGATIGARALNAGVKGLGVGAASGALSAEPGERVTGALEGGAVGGLVAGAVPPLAAGARALATGAQDIARTLRGEPTALLNVPANPTLPPPRGLAAAGTPPTSPPSAQELVAAANRRGFDLPVFMATENRATQAAAEGTRNIPGAGGIVRDAADTVSTNLGRTSDALAETMRAGLPGRASAAVAGQELHEGITQWMTKESQAAASAAYQRVEDTIVAAGKAGTSQGMKTLAPLTNTAKEVRALVRENTASALPPGNTVGMLGEAINRGELTYEGMKGLRSRVGQMMNDSIMRGDRSQAELGRVYDALTSDLKRAVGLAGGPAAKTQFLKANADYEKISRMREGLAKIVGTDGAATPEQVYARLSAMATSGSKGDLANLIRVRDVLGRHGAGQWQEFQGALISGLGRDMSAASGPLAQGGFSPAKFLTAWGKMSEGAKKVIFDGDPEWRRAINDIATISLGIRDKVQRFSNPSGTAQSLIGAGTVAGLVSSPITTLTTIIGARGMANALSRPVTARMVADWANLAAQHAQRPTPATQALMHNIEQRLAAYTSGEGGQLIGAH